MSIAKVLKWNVTYLFKKIAKGRICFDIRHFELQSFKPNSWSNELMISECVWIFNGIRSEYPSGVFEIKEKAELWIKQYSLVGTLTKYPVNISAYDYAIKYGYFNPKKEYHKTPNFIGRFTAGFIDHDHYDDQFVPHIPEFDKVKENTSFALTGWVWIFNGESGDSPSGVFDIQSKAELWIKCNSLSGVLLKYPVGISTYAWAIANNLFTPQDDTQRSPAVISTLGWEYLERVYYKQGLRWKNGDVKSSSTGDEKI